MKGFKRKYIDSIRVGWFLATRQLRRSGKGTTALIIGIMVLTFLNLVVVSGILLGLITGSFDQFRKDYSGDVIVTAEAGHDYIENSPALISYLRNYPGVVAVSARHTVGADILGTLNENPKKFEHPNSIATTLSGMNVTDEIAVTNFPKFIMKGQMLDPNQDGYILIGYNVLRKYSSYADANVPNLELLDNVDIGSRVRVTLSNPDGSKVVKDFIVRGIIKSKIDQISIRAFINDDELSRMLSANAEQYQEIAVRTASPAMAAPLVAQIKGFMGSYSARIQTSDEAIPSFLRDIETTMRVLGDGLSSFALAVAMITIFIVVFINAVTKRKFIGIMKGIGVSPLAIESAYVFQAFFYGLVGSAIGLIITFGALKPYFDAHPIDFPFSDGILVATPDGAAIRVAILLAVTLIAGYVPAKLIVRRNTLDSILGR